MKTLILATLLTGKILTSNAVENFQKTSDIFLATGRGDTEKQAIAWMNFNASKRCDPLNVIERSETEIRWYRERFIVWAVASAEFECIQD